MLLRFCWRTGRSLTFRLKSCVLAPVRNSKDRILSACPTTCFLPHGKRTDRLNLCFFSEDVQLDLDLRSGGGNPFRCMHRLGGLTCTKTAACRWLTEATVVCSDFHIQPDVEDLCRQPESAPRAASIDAIFLLLHQLTPLPPLLYFSPRQFLELHQEVNVVEGQIPAQF